VFGADPRGQQNYVVVLGVLGVPRPAQIVNYRTIGSAPIVLAVGLAGDGGGAVPDPAAPALSVVLVVVGALAARLPGGPVRAESIGAAAPRWRPRK
jgi:hypothetical protein